MPFLIIYLAYYALSSLVLTSRLPLLVLVEGEGRCPHEYVGYAS
ncbi:hypothetical protein XBP1_1190001 [Xenorhabdus bovienii str. puntauvense]|uniref:Uncharacterized protein n=1 Tax=Xenorhabdus bovienii str. puntauvense TaxID=1398201 RepID=A0A077MZN4_XENBV|nr:hypothetical protein XBFFR1_800001 [Xenorhabdus bovienii str. feltiae France]CDG91582.1 hypothetical protein XBFFL1_1660001 [Xenorhabdus bovienii str. feltiae Florida]CDG95276.1 hypothetical protein XBP1_1190001 [Xenorhabdus bovienii str. puntauvense]